MLLLKLLVVYVSKDEEAMQKQTFHMLNIREIQVFTLINAALFASAGGAGKGTGELPVRSNRAE